MRINKVYTKTGDSGETGLVGGQRLHKCHPRIEAYGTVDELASMIGWARQELHLECKTLSESEMAFLDSILEFIGNKLFTLGGDLATKIEDRHPAMPVIVQNDINFLERVCDSYNAELPPLQDFILPGGSRTASALHMARTIARRAERTIVALSLEEETGGFPETYLNRLSDALFVLARWVNKRQGAAEVIWRRDLPEPELPS